jgi:outer membrane protein assembly factor BamB
MYPSTSQSSVLGIDRDTGEIRMQTPPDDPFVEPRGSVCVDDGVVYVSVLDDPPITRGYDATTGERIREYDLNPSLHSDKSPFINDGTLYSPVDFALGAFDARSEENLWTYTPGKQIYGTPALVDDTIYVGMVETDPEELDSGDEKFPHASRLHPQLQALDAETGTVEWSRNIIPRPNTPAVVEETCFICGREPYRRYMSFDAPDAVGESTDDEMSDGGIPKYGIVHALATDEGAERWRAELSDPISTPPAVGDGRVVVGTRNGEVIGLNSTAGEIMWRLRPETDERIRTSPAIADGVVYIGCENKIYALDVQSGAERWQYELETEVDSSPAVVEGVLYISGHDNVLRAIA